MRHRPIRFLTLDVVLALHLIAIRDQDGDPGVRDIGLLESAISLPQQGFGGDFLHPDIPSMAAAYAFHICMNHPFVDGNKRTALAAMLAFLADNGWEFEAMPDEVETVILRLATSQISKEELTAWTKKHAREKPSLELRDLFRSLTPEAMQSLQDALERSPDPELAATVEETIEAIPLAANRFDAAAVARQEGDDLRDAVASGQALLLVLIYRIAEDMGYEW